MPCCRSAATLLRSLAKLLAVADELASEEKRELVSALVAKVMTPGDV